MSVLNAQQLREWKGDFGREYTDRQKHHDTRPTFTMILHPYLARIDTILEVGCNRGDNLYRAWPGKTVCAVEPAAYARAQARKRGLFVVDGTAQNLPFVDEYFDLVFTAGVLIHIPWLDPAMAEIHRVAKRYILAIEYPAKRPTPVDYRGIRHGIWKRNYGYEYQVRHPDLTLIGEGITGMPFPDSAWWLLEKEMP